MVKTEIEARRIALADYVFVDVRKFDKNGEPEYFEEFTYITEQPQRIHNPNYQASDPPVFPGVHYRDVKYRPVPSNEWDDDFDPRSLIKPPPPKPIAWIKENIRTAFLVLAAFAGIICVLTKL